MAPRMLRRRRPVWVTAPHGIASARGLPNRSWPHEPRSCSSLLLPKNPSPIPPDRSISASRSDFAPRKGIAPRLDCPLGRGGCFDVEGVSSYPLSAPTFPSAGISSVKNWKLLRPCGLSPQGGARRHRTSARGAGGAHGLSGMHPPCPGAVEGGNRKGRRRALSDSGVCLLQSMTSRIR